MSNGIKSVRKPTTSRLDPQIKKLQKILEDPKTDRDTTIATRKELKKLKASVKKNPMSAMRKGIKPKPNVAAEKKKALLDIKNGSGIAGRSAARKAAIQKKRKELAKPEPLEAAKKAPKPKPGGSGIAAKAAAKKNKIEAQRKKEKAAKPKPKVVKKAPSKKVTPRPKRTFTDPTELSRFKRAVAKRKGMRGTEVRPSVARPVVGSKGMRGTEVRPSAKLPKEIFGPTTKVRPTRKPVLGTPGSMDDAGIRTLVDAADAGTRFKKRPVRKSIKTPGSIDDAGIRTLVDAADAGTRFKKKPKKSIFGFKQISGAPDWSAGPKEYETPFGNIKVDSTPYEDTLSEQEREQKEAEGVLKKGGKIGKKKKKVSKKKQGYKARKDESIAMRVKKKRTKKKLKASRDESYGKWGSKKGKGKINRSSGSALVASLYD